MGAERAIKPLFDRWEELGDGPSLHAFVIGVSDYSHLSGHDDPARERHWGMKKLESGALSAYRIHEWLIKRRDKLTAPLARSHVLLSPSPREMEIEPTLAHAPKASRYNFEAAVAEWKQGAIANRQNVMFFYFAGHGLQLRDRRHVLLMEGFGGGIGPKLRDGIDSDELFRGMTPDRQYPNLSARQIYFFDACRVSTNAASQEYEELKVPIFWDIGLSNEDPRTAPLFYTTMPGTRAFGRAGDSTVFSQALLRCLEGAAAEPTDAGIWQVTLNSLINKLQSELDLITAVQRVQAHGVCQPLVLHTLDAAPDVRIEICIDPGAAAQHIALIRINDADERLVREYERPVAGTFTDRLPGGLYQVQTIVKPPAPPYKDRYFARRAELPSQTWRLRLTAD